MPYFECETLRTQNICILSYSTTLSHTCGQFNIYHTIPDTYTYPVTAMSHSFTQAPRTPVQGHMLTNHLSLSGRRLHPNFHTVNLTSFQFWRNGLFPSARNKTLSNHRLSGPRGSWEHPIPTSRQEAQGKLHNRPLSSCLRISCQGAHSLQRPSPPLLGKL